MSLKMMPLVLVLAFPVLACAQDAQAQRGSGGGEPGPRRPPSSLELLLENREALALTPEQVGQVSALRSALEEKNAPLLQKLEALRPPRPPGPPPGGADRISGGPPGGAPPDAEAMRERRQQVEPLFQELRANDEAAYAEAEKLLSDAQKTRARARISQAREEEHRRREATRERMRSRP
ncbi:Spy/CpxP family protein refolding chaperone [Pyxidicoccus sp. 3LG]